MPTHCNNCTPSDQFSSQYHLVDTSINIRACTTTDSACCLGQHVRPYHRKFPHARPNVICATLWGSTGAALPSSPSLSTPSHTARSAPSPPLPKLHIPSDPTDAAVSANSRSVALSASASLPPTPRPHHAGPGASDMQSQTL